MATYLGYVQGGKCRDTHAPLRDEAGEPIKQPNIHKQFWVIDELAAMGITAWCGRRIDFKRSGKDRFAEAHESPALPNYLFIEMTPAQFVKAIGVKFLANSLQLIARCDHDDLAVFKEGVEAKYSAAQRIDANSRAAVSEYTKGQRVEAIAGSFTEYPMWFKQVVQKAHDQWPRVEVDVEMLGGTVTMQLDPLDVRAVG